MILDTNVYGALVAGEPTAVVAIAHAPHLVLPLPVIAELRFGFANGSRVEHNEHMLERFLSQPNVDIMMPSLVTTEYYAALQTYCRQHGRALSHNDIWIAALTQESGDTLLTYDQDFAVFQDMFGDALQILAYGS